MRTDFQIELESKPCPMGCPFGDEVLFTAHDRLHGLPGEFNVVKCRTCGLMRTNPRPTQQTIGFYYPDYYGPYQGTRVDLSNAAVNSAHPFWKQIILRIFELNTYRLPNLLPGRLLEIGCASGSFLHRMASKGWEVEGLEFSEKAADSAHLLGYSVYTGPVELAPDPKHPFNLVVGWMVFEHVHDPLIVLRKLCRWLRPDGWLVISVPNAGSLEFSIFKKRWYALHLPNHLYHYTPETLCRIMRSGGWRIEKVFHQRTLSNFIASIGYWLKDHATMKRLSDLFIAYPERAGIMHYLIYPLTFLLSLFGQTGRMTVWARRLDD